MKILHAISGIWEHTGGPAETVPRLCSELVTTGHQVTIATLAGPLSTAALASRQVGVNIQTYGHAGQLSASMIRGINQLSKEADLVHGHGLWLPANWATGRAAKKSGKPLIISLRGALNPNALQHSRWKKRIAGLLFDNSNLQAAHCLHATSQEEYRAVRDYGLRNPVAIIPNGVDAVLFDQLLDSVELRQKFSVPTGKKILLYLSRISWEKGLEDLAEAWGRVSPDFQEWVLLIVGSGQREYVERLKALFEGTPGRERVIWAGMLTGRDKLAAYAAANLFVLPSHTENFSLVTAEALAAGVPVITTQGTPWSELVDGGCGWWVPIGFEGLAPALREALALPEDQLQAMGASGKILIARKYVWKQVASQMIDVYRWMLDGGEPPGCLRLD